MSRPPRAEVFRRFFPNFGASFASQIWLIGVGLATLPVIVRGKGKRYSWHIGEAPLAKVANVEKSLPRSYISKDGYGITAKARQYLSPLIEGEDHPPYKNGLPSYVKLNGKLVRKKLAPFDVG